MLLGMIILKKKRLHFVFINLFDAEEDAKYIFELF